MNRNVKLLIVVGSILIILTVLFLAFGNHRDERYEQQKAMSLRNSANPDEVACWTEAEEYELANKRQQLGFLLVGIVIVLVALIAWVRERRQATRETG